MVSNNSSLPYHYYSLSILLNKVFLIFTEYIILQKIIENERQQPSKQHQKYCKILDNKNTLQFIQQLNQLALMIIHDLIKINF